VARKRMLTPTIWTNPKFLKLTHFERLLFIGLISFADDEGWHTKDELAIKAEIFPVDNVTTDEIINGLFRLAEVGLIKTYEAAVELPGWHEHQSIKKPQPSRLKLSKSISVPHQFPTSSPPVPPNRIEKNKREGRECAPARENPLTLDFSKFESEFPEVDHQQEFDRCYSYYKVHGKQIMDWNQAYQCWLTKPYPKVEKHKKTIPVKMILPKGYKELESNVKHFCSKCKNESTPISDDGRNEVSGYFCQYCGTLDSGKIEQVEIVKN